MNWAFCRANITRSLLRARLRTSVARCRCDDHAPCVHLGGVLAVPAVIAAHHLDQVTAHVEHGGVDRGPHVLLRHHASVGSGRQRRAGPEQELQQEQSRGLGPAQRGHAVFSVSASGTCSRSTSDRSTSGGEAPPPHHGYHQHLIIHLAINLISISLIISLFF